MSLLSKRLMKWREPKAKGIVTLKNILTAVLLIFIIAIPFGFIGGSGRFFSGYFSMPTYFLGLGFLSVAVLSLAIQPLLPGVLVQIRDDMIVRGARGTNSQRSAYKDIDCIYFNRGLHSNGQNLSVFSVVMKNDVIKDDVIQFSYATFRSVHQFVVPASVNVEQVLQILRNKGVNVIEGQLPS